PVRTALFTRDPLHDVKDAYATMSREESYRGIPETSKAINIKMNATSFAAKSYNQNKRGNTNNFNRNNTRGNGPNNYNRGPNPNLVCNNCGFTGHTNERCYELIGYPPRYKRGLMPLRKMVLNPTLMLIVILKEVTSNPLLVTLLLPSLLIRCRNVTPPDGAWTEYMSEGVTS
ncbi:hypothetical protein Tco_1296658, partial [Tanacetum coccineum]